MTELNTTPRTSVSSMLWGVAHGGLLAVIFGGVVVGGLVILDTMNSEKDESLAEALGQVLGEVEGAHAEAQMLQEAEFKHALAAAEAEVKRISEFYTGFYQAVGMAAQKASDWEGQLIARQGAATSNNDFVETLGANVLSFGCIGAALDPYDSQMKGLCDASNNLERDMVGEFTDLPNYRPRYVEDVLNDFPHPHGLISPEFERVMAQYSGVYEDVQ